MRKYQYFLMLWFLATTGAYAMALDHGAQHETALLIAGAVAVTVAGAVAGDEEEAGGTASGVVLSGGVVQKTLRPFFLW